MAGKINNSPPPDADFGMVDASGRVKISPVWYRFLTTKQDAGEILVAGSVGGESLGGAVQPPSVLSGYFGNATSLAHDPSPDEAANRTSVVSVTVPQSYSARRSIEVWAAGRFAAGASSNASIAIYCNVGVAGFNMDPGLYGASKSFSIVSSGDFVSEISNFSTAILLDVIDAAAPARTYTLFAKRVGDAGASAAIQAVTIYAKVTNLA